MAATTNNTNPTNNKRDASQIMNNDNNNNKHNACSSCKPLSRRQRGSLSTLLHRKSPFSNETGSLPIGELDVTPGSATSASSLLRNAKILVVGAGGLGLVFFRQMNTFNYPGVTTVILAILGLILIGEVVSHFARKAMI